MPAEPAPAAPVAPERLEAIAARILSAAGASATESRTVAHYLVRSDLAGHASHGVIRVRQYLEQIRKGEIVCGQLPRLVNEGPGFAVIDGRLGFGQIGAAHATALACDKAATQGISLVTLANIGHVGRLGDWVEQAAERGCISLHFVNTLSTPKVAPWGSRERRLSTNPLAWGMPLAGSHPLVMDLTTSVVAEGKVRAAHAAGKAIPEGWVLDKAGRPTTEPGALYDDGTLLPLGGLDAGHKGYALSLMVDLMAGALSGGGASGPERKVNCNNFTIIAIDPKQVGADDSIVAEATRFARWVQSAAPADPARPVQLPGDTERAAQQCQRRDGIALDAGAWRSLAEAATMAGLASAEIDALMENHAT